MTDIYSSVCHSTASLKCGLACKLQNTTANGNEVEHKLVTQRSISCSRSLEATELVGAENCMFEKSLFFFFKGNPSVTNLGEGCNF